MKKALLVSVLLAGLAVSVVGCVNNNSNNSSISSQESASGSEESSSELPVDDPYAYADEHLQQVDPYKYETTYRSMRINGSGNTAEQYTRVKNDNKESKYVIQDVKALVIPVDFPDYPASSLPLGEEGTREELERVMFGSDEEMDWYSLAGYYESSSFGQCHISGTVGDWYHVTQVSTAYAKEFGTNGSQKVAIAIQDMYRAKYSEAKKYMPEGEERDAIMAKYDLTQYDANEDGYIDSIIMIYTAPITTTGELFWAFCWSVGGAYGRYNPEYEGANRFFWASYWFFYDGELDHKSGKYPVIPDDLPGKIVNGEVKPDVHTMTHEYGHVLGLPDYYITDYNSADFDGMGYLDMMDYNIGDHNAMSKSWYGWIDPYYVTGSVKTTIRSTTRTGDTILIPIQGEYKNTLMDQFIMIEFLTPEGVAEYDGLNPFNGTYPLYYSKAGIRVIHVDARLGSFNYNNDKKEWQFTGFTSSTNSSGSGHSVSTACSNTATDSCFSNYKLLEVLPRTGKSIKTIGAASNDTLFVEGDTFGASTGAWANYKMHDMAGGKTIDLGFSFEITKINGNESAEITITKLK